MEHQSTNNVVFNYILKDIVYCVAHVQHFFVKRGEVSAGKFPAEASPVIPLFRDFEKGTLSSKKIRGAWWGRSPAQGDNVKKKKVYT